ncbi:MAG: MFS transporter [Sphingomonadales bacterium]|nr:MFS transporter [Sphingomonadales bacterium]
MPLTLTQAPIALKLALTSYLVSVATFIPLSGWMADRFGAKRVFVIAILVFMAGSLACTSANSLMWFVGSRFLQGMGGAMMTPVGRLVLLRSIDKSALVNAMTWVTVPALIGPVIGPPLGGFITTYFSWHWIFLINIPIGIAGIVIAVILFTASLPLGLVVHPASVQDRDGLALVCARIRRQFPWLRLLFADAGYQGELAACAAAAQGLRLAIVKRPIGSEGFQLVPRRWVIERTFAWLGRNRRLAKDFERLIATSTAMVVLAIIQLLARRMASH